MPYGSAHSLRGHAFFVKGLGGKFGQVTIGDDLSVGNEAKFPPDELPERTSCRSEGEFGRRRAFAGKIAVQP